MADARSSPGFFTGLLAGALLTIPLVVLFWLGSGLAGLPFVPFDVFDWTARVLPGPLITFGIDTMVGAIRSLGIGDISQAAKTSEQIFAVAGLLITGTLAGGVVFALPRSAGRRAVPAAGLIAGLVIGIPVLLISLAVNVTATAPPVLSGIWILVAFIGWGWLLGRSRDRLSRDTGTGESGVAVEAIDRRRFLVRLGGASAVITVAGAAVASRLGSSRGAASRATPGEPWSGTNPLPNANASVEPVPGTRPELTPVDDHYRIDINTRPPVLEEADWRLRITGLVEEPITLTLEDLRTQYEPENQFVTLACISNPIAGSLTSTQRWTGVPLRTILDQVRPTAEATHLRISSVDGFHEVAAIEDIRNDGRIMLAYEWDGLPLPVRNGFPLRVYIPDRYGMKQPKWITSIEAIAGPEDGYWVSRGWDRVARMNATSVIDTVGVDMMVAEASAGMLIPIGGIAHAGARGISRVEVRVDDGQWQEASLRDPLSGTTWVIWRFEWPFAAGDHTFTVRCFEGDGTPQVAARSPVRPSGATGLHSENIMM